MTYETREQWLGALAKALRPLFDAEGAEIPVFRITCGFPSAGALAPKKRKLGQCWHGASSADGTAEVIVTPLVDNAEEIGGIVAHELAHACLGPDVGHKAAFARLGRAIGLEGKPTSMGTGEAFKIILAPILKDLGAYPHARLNAQSRKRQSTRLLKVECGNCGYVCRVTRKWLDDAGPPICPTHGEPMDVTT